MNEAEEKKTEYEAPGKGKRRRRRRKPFGLHEWIRFFSAASVLLAALFVVAAIMAFDHYKLYPGRVERDTISSPGRGSDYIVISWDGTHNTEVYKVWCKENEPVTEEVKKTEEEEQAADKEREEVVIDDSWTELETDVPEATFRDLKEDTSYSFIVRADSKDKEGTPTAPRSFRTKKPQKIQVSKKITKFTFSEPFKLDVNAETDVMIESEDPDVAEVDSETQEIKLKGEGKTTITVTAKSSREFESASKAVALEVIDSTQVSAGGASAHTIYHLDADNCEVVKRVTGAGGAVIPQGLAYTGDQYIISYGMGNPDRVISFDVDGDGKSVSVPSLSLGHPNGFTYADENGLCYCAKGWTSKVFTYEPATDSYGSVGLSYGCSGIGYDRKEKLLYTCSRTAMVAYDISEGYSIKYRCGVVDHDGDPYTQDCGGRAGIMYRCLSGSSKHGINYIDLYDMKKGRYLGTLSCDLSEVESCIVDKDGFLEILANNTSNTDYIWKTEINADTLGEGL
jgi:hypothetical protein